MKYLISSALILFAARVAASEEVHPLSDEFINGINEEQSYWKAGKNFDSDTPLEYISSLMGVDESIPDYPMPTKNFHPASLRDIPRRFDARIQWPACKSIQLARDQAGCGSCWAVAGASAMTDRICIKSNGEDTTSVSAADLMSCCSFCGNGCKGGSVWGPWVYWERNGISSGGTYHSNGGCKDYPFRPCAHVYGSSKPECRNETTPKCTRTCRNNPFSYKSQLTFGNSAYKLSTVAQIQNEILEHGPVEAGFAVYADFASYKSGVYYHVKGELLGLHAVKIIGWGTENGLPYWLIANSWNEEWGDKGFFKFLRGYNHCDIESSVYASVPKL